MAGAAVSYDDSQLKAIVRDVGGGLSRVSDGEVLLDEIGAYVETSVRLRFEQEVGPEGKPWPKTRRGTSILKGSPPRLMSSITRHTSRDRTEVGTNAIHAAIHQFGGTIRPKRGRFLVFTGADGNLVFARKVEMLARPFLGIDTADEAEIEAIIGDFLAESFE